MAREQQWRPVRAWLILVHRYPGIALSLLFLAWFVSGIAMIYARHAQAHAPIPARPFTSNRFRSASASRLAGRRPRRPAAGTGRTTLLSIQGRPAYRFSDPPAATVLADTGDVMKPVGERESVDIAARFAGVAPDRVRYLRQLDIADQWTITQRRQLPLHKIAVEDSAGTRTVCVGSARRSGRRDEPGEPRAGVDSGDSHWLYFSRRCE